MSATFTVTIPPSSSPVPLDADEGSARTDRRHRKSMTVPRLICVNAVVCGLELCANAGFAYIPPILLKAGLSETVMSYVMGIGPVIALFSVPAIGAWSDRSRCPWGKRRPFILLLNLLMLSSLILIPFGHFHAAAADGSQHYQLGPFGNASISASPINPTSADGPSPRIHWTETQTFKTVLLAIGVVLLDYASQACFNPCEALLTDVMKDDPNVERGFVVYSAMLSLGACLGTLTTAVDWTTVAEVAGVDVSTLIFGLLFLVSTACLAVTLAAAKEPAPPILASAAVLCSYRELSVTNKVPSTTGHCPLGDAVLDEVVYQQQQQHKEPLSAHEKAYKIQQYRQHGPMGGRLGGQHASSSTSTSGHSNGGDRTRAVFVLACSMPRYADRAVRRILRGTAAVGSLAVTGLFCPSRQHQHQHRHLPCPRFNLGIFGLVWCLVVSLFRLVLEIFKWPLKFYRTYRDSPEALKRLFIADLASWTCLMGHGIFYTDFVAQAIYNGAPDAHAGSDKAFGYDEGARMGSWGLCFFSIVGFGYSTFVQEWVVGKIGLKWNYLACLSALSMCMIGHIWFQSIFVLNALSALAGVGFAAVTSVPNTLITVYHAHIEVYDPQAVRKTSLVHRISALDDDGQQKHLNVNGCSLSQTTEGADSSHPHFYSSDCDDHPTDHDRGVATDISLLDAAYFLSQIILSLTMGYLVDLTGSTRTYMAASAAAGLLSVYLATKVPFTKAHLKALLLNKNSSSR